MLQCDRLFIYLRFSFLSIQLCDFMIEIEVFQLRHLDSIGLLSQEVLRTSPLALLHFLLLLLFSEVQPVRICSFNLFMPEQFYVDLEPLNQLINVELVGVFFLHFRTTRVKNGIDNPPRGYPQVHILAEQLKALSGGREFDWCLSDIKLGNEVLELREFPQVLIQSFFF